MPIAHLQICKGIYSIYLPIPTMLPPFNWVTINPNISREVVLFSLLNDGPWRGLNHGPLDPQSPALPSELSAIDLLLQAQVFVFRPLATYIIAFGLKMTC